MAVASLHALGIVLVRAPRPRISRRAVAVAGVAVLVMTVSLAAGVSVAFPTVARASSPSISVRATPSFSRPAMRALVDGGPDPARTLRALGDALPPFARRIDVVALTHSHADHGTGLIAVLDRYEVALA